MHDVYDKKTILFFLIMHIRNILFIMFFVVYDQV
jgi:hypothetical protein